MLPVYSRVMLVTDKYKGDGGRRGMMGYIIEVYEDGNYEIEFSDATTGTTSTQLVANDQDIVLAPEPGEPGES